MKLSFVPLLLGGKTLSDEARKALREDRREDAAALLMQQYDLDCHEAGALLDLSICEESEFDRLMKHPDEIGGAETQTAGVRVSGR
jgi:hypothetical protein